MAMDGTFVKYYPVIPAEDYPMIAYTCLGLEFIVLSLTFM